MIQVFIFLNRKYKIIWYYYYYSLLSHRASERRENKFSTKKYISICEILVVTTLCSLSTEMGWEWGGSRSNSNKKKRKGKKTYKRNQCFQVAYHWRLKSASSTRSKIVHPKLGMLTLYTIPEHIKVVAT